MPIGTLLAGQFDFRLPFVVFGGVLVVALILLWGYVPQPTVPLSDQLTLQSALEGYVALLQQREGLAAVVIFMIMFAGNSLFTTYLPTWLGRVTYEIFAEYWPSQTDEGGFAEQMNSMRKYVVSKIPSTRTTRRSSRDTSRMRSPR